MGTDNFERLYNVHIDEENDEFICDEVTKAAADIIFYTDYSTDSSGELLIGILYTAYGHLLHWIGFYGDRHESVRNANTKHELTALLCKLIHAAMMIEKNVYDNEDDLSYILRTKRFYEAFSNTLTDEDIDHSEFFCKDVYTWMFDCLTSAQRSLCTSKKDDAFIRFVADVINTAAVADISLEDIAGVFSDIYR